MQTFTASTTRPPRRLLMVGAALLATTCLGVPSAFSFELKRDSESRAVYWQQPEVIYRVDAAGARDLSEAQVLRAVKAGFAEWTGYADRMTLRFGGVVDGAEVGYDNGVGAVNTNLVAFSRDAWPYDSDTALALTLTTYKTNGGGLIDADIIFNERTYTWGDAPADGHDLQNTLTHEIGHFLGLAHSDEPEATMYARAAPGETKKRTLHTDDVQGIQAIYGGDGLHPTELAEAEAPLAPKRLPGCQALPGLPSGSGWWLFAFAAGLALGRRRLLAGLTVLGAVWLAQVPAQAAVVQALDLETLVVRADVVVEGPVLAATAHWVGGLIVTESVVAVEVCHAGPCPEAVHIRTLGGEVGELGQHVEGVATFSRGERALVFAGRPGPDGHRAVVGLAQGKFTVVPDVDGGWAFRALDTLDLVGPARSLAGHWRAVSVVALRQAIAAIARR